MKPLETPQTANTILNKEHDAKELPIEICSSGSHVTELEEAIEELRTAQLKDYEKLQDIHVCENTKHIRNQLLPCDLLDMKD